MSTRYFQMNDEYDLVEVSRAVAANPPFDWPGNNACLRTEADGTKFLDVNFGNVDIGVLMQLLDLVKS